jgi:hypothetical protein
LAPDCDQERRLWLATGVCLAGVCPRPERADRGVCVASDGLRPLSTRGRPRPNLTVHEHHLDVPPIATWTRLIDVKVEQPEVGAVSDRDAPPHHLHSTKRCCAAFFVVCSSLSTSVIVGGCECRHHGLDLSERQHSSRTSERTQIGFPWGTEASARTRHKARHGPGA